MASSAGEVNRAHSGSSSRHRRRLCGHCNEELSYSAYRSHRALYYSETDDRWLSTSTHTDSHDHVANNHSSGLDSDEETVQDGTDFTMDTTGN